MLRADFFKACLLKLGLRVNQHEQSVPSLSSLHLSAQRASDVSELVFSWQEIITTVKSGEEIIKGENDTFVLGKTFPHFSTRELQEAMPGRTIDSLKGQAVTDKHDAASNDAPLNHDHIPKHIIPHEEELPSSKETPYFNHHAFFSNLHEYALRSSTAEAAFGKHLLYGEVVTSTSTLLEKNPSFLRHLPAGFTATATTQIAGRGRGSNVWVSPRGSLMFSTVMRHGMSLTEKAPVIFIQHLAALAVVNAVQTYEPGYAKIPVRLKWPNDIYALDGTGAPPSTSNTTAADRARFVKIGGILVSSSYVGSGYTLVVGIGLNVSNSAPTTGLNKLAAAASLPPFENEKLLARILTCLEDVYSKFCRDGWSRELEADYYKNWLHGDQIVTLEAEGGVRARIKGVTRDWGLLLAEELGPEDRPTGKVWQLQSDNNSFDFFKGLLKKKI